MSKLNRITATQAKTTHEGGEAREYTDKEQLFLLGASNFVSEDAYYEKANERDERFVDLARAVAVADPEWFSRYVTWLRTVGNMRSAPVVAAVEGALALVGAGIPGGRAIINNALQRPDEPGEALAYARSRGAVPKAIKRGIADAATRLYTQKSLLKYDSKNRAYSFGDVIRLTHPKPTTVEQSNLFQYATVKNLSHARIPESLGVLSLRESTTFEDILKDPSLVHRAGITWESMSSLSPEGMSARVWELLIPSMGYMALLRNLRNFKQAGVSASVYDSVLEKLSSQDQVERSKQLPMRFLSAFRSMSGDLHAQSAIEKALNHSLQRVPSLDGSTLILVDRSGSMSAKPSDRSELTLADSASIFGTALALRADNATLVQFGSTSSVIPFSRGDSILPIVDRYGWLGGTYTSQALARHYNGHSRVVIVTDEQAWGDPTVGTVPSTVPVYTFNLAGYANASTTGRINIGGGLTDASFSTISIIESAKSGNFPF